MALRLVSGPRELPATVSLFRALCHEREIETRLHMRLPEIIEGTLFDMTGSSN
jgi:hypothetical protein